MGLLGNYYKLALWQEILMIVALLLLWLLYKNFRFVKKMRNPSIIEMQEEQMHDIMKSFPKESSDFLKEHFVFYDAFIFDVALNEIDVFIYRHKEEAFYYYIFHYPKNKDNFMLFATYFTNAQTLTTTNSPYLKYHPFLEDDFYQYFPDKTNKELLEYHKKGSAYLKTKLKSEIISFSNQKAHREFYLKSQIEAMAKNGYFPILRFHKAAMTNDMSRYTKPIVNQIEGEK